MKKKVFLYIGLALLLGALFAFSYFTGQMGHDHVVGSGCCPGH